MVLPYVHSLLWITLLTPLLGAVCAGLTGKAFSVGATHRLSVGFMTAAFIAACMLLQVVLQHRLHLDFNAYTWALSGRYQFHVGFLLDALSASMLCIVSFVSWLVHIYSIGYMRGDSGYRRFFSYMSLFTFFMFMLCSANNFLQLFFGWEGVGLVSYLLIGFWFKKDSAAAGSLKAFIVNRVGDFGMIIGLAFILQYVGSLNYSDLFAMLPQLQSQTVVIFPAHHGSLLSVICICLFIGAMAKSAQIPLHVWLPESMEGPTPISALIHAATMVTAGVFMLARLSPLFHMSATASALVLVVGATSALFLGMLALVENDIKRVIAYSTMSQLGYMMAANGVAAYQAAIFHLITHACFKALLFLAAGSVIVALQHEQDLRKMGGLWRYLPWTYATFLIGSLALAAIPPFAGFYSKDAIIDAVRLSSLPGANYAYICLLLGAFVTAWYIFRAFFMAFHGASRRDDTQQIATKTPREPGWSMRFALLALAIPSVVLGGVLLQPMLLVNPAAGWFSGVNMPHMLIQASVSVQPAWLASAGLMIWHALFAPVLWFSIAGILCAYLCVLVMPETAARCSKRLAFLRQLLQQQYGFDSFNQLVLVRGVKKLSYFLFTTGDEKWIDGVLVNGLGRQIRRLAVVLRRLQTGYLYHYVFSMLFGLLIFMAWILLAR